MSPTCSNLKKKGFCTQADCGLDHPDVCDVCDGIRIIQPNATARDLHYLSEKHLRSAYERGVVDESGCSICANVVILNQFTFISHYAGKPHRKKADAQGVSPYAVLSPTALRCCRPCNRLIQNHNWLSHCSSLGHRQKATPPKQPNGAPTVQSANVELGYVSPDAQAATFRVQVQLPVGRVKGYIKDINLSSTALSAFKVISPPTTLTGVSPGYVGIRFCPSGLAGRIRCKMTLALASESSGSAGRFCIVQDLSLTVGRQSILKPTAPVTPYAPVKPKKRSWQRTVRGERIPFGRNIEFTESLLEYEVPSTLREALWKKKRGEQEATLYGLIPDGLNEHSFSIFWSTLLHAEEMQVEENIAAFNMSMCTLKKEGSLFKLRVPGLAENRPSILLGDKIALFPSETEGERFIGYVHQVEEKSVLIHLRDFDANRKYDVEFCPSRSTFRRKHQAVQLGHRLPHLLFPNISLLGQRLGGLRRFIPLDSRILDNPPQRNAVSAILGLQGMSPPYIVFGPPGTGKTLVVVEAIQQILSVPGARILATAPSNSAADVIAERLARFGVTPDIMFRLNALSRRYDDMPASLAEFSCAEGRRFNVPPISQLLQYRIVVSTCISSSFLFATGAPRGHFDYIFIDEAGYALEPEALVPILTIADVNTRVVLSGDPKQLGPITHSACASSFNFGKSFLERLMELGVYSRVPHNPFITKLVQNYRSHPSILHFPNRKFYDSELVAMVDGDIANRFIHWNELRGTNFPVIFHAIHGEDKRESTSPSYFNLHEIDLVDRYLDALLGDPALDARPDDIGIISPYSAQNKKLRELDIVKKHRKELKTGTVEAFQAQERPIIVMSTVRSSPEHINFDLRHFLGFVAHPKRLNVAVTRARSLLVIVGDPHVLSSDQVWNEFLHYIRSRGGWRGVDFNLPELDDGDGDALISMNIHANAPSYDYEVAIRESD